MQCAGCQVFRSQMEYRRIEDARESGRLDASLEWMQLTTTTLLGTKYAEEYGLPAYSPQLAARNDRKFHDGLRQKVRRAYEKRGAVPSMATCVKLEPHPKRGHYRLHGHSINSYGDVLPEVRGLRSDGRDGYRFRLNWAHSLRLARTSSVREALKHAQRDRYPGSGEVNPETGRRKQDRSSAATRFRAVVKTARELLPVRDEAVSEGDHKRARKKARRVLQDAAAATDVAADAEFLRSLASRLEYLPSEVEQWTAWLWVHAERHAIGTMDLKRKALSDAGDYLTKEVTGWRQGKIPRDRVEEVMRKAYRPLVKGQKQLRRSRMSPAFQRPAEELADVPTRLIEKWLSPGDPALREFGDAERMDLFDLDQLARSQRPLDEQRYRERLQAVHRYAADVERSGLNVEDWEALRRLESSLTGRLRRSAGRGLDAIVAYQAEHGLPAYWYIRELADDSRYSGPYALGQWDPWADETKFSPLRFDYRAKLAELRAVRLQLHGFRTLLRDLVGDVPMNSRGVVGFIRARRDGVRRVARIEWRADAPFVVLDDDAQEVCD